MKYFIVEEISNALGICGETVRRWIRSGEIKAIALPSRKGSGKGKGGYQIPESELDKIIAKTSKYESVEDFIGKYPYYGHEIEDDDDDYADDDDTERIYCRVARKIWAIACKSPKYGNVVIDLIGMDAYCTIARLQHERRT